MKIVVLYRSNSDHGRAVEEYVHEYRSRHQGARVEVLKLESREGSAMASLYDVMSYPTIMALANDGSVLKSWQGTELPLMDDLAYYSYMLEG